MKVISLLAQKGGVGKTTLCLHWAVEALAHTRDTVGVLDIDPQRSAVSWARRRDNDRPLVLDVPGAPLARVLDDCRSDGFAYAFVDTRPSVREDSEEAARHADLVVIPCGPSIVDIDAISATVSIAERMEARAVFVLNQGRSGSSINEKAIDLLASQYGLPVCPTVIMRRAVLADAFIAGRAVGEVEPAGKAAKEIADSWAWIAAALSPALSRTSRESAAKGAR
jgi:chromosome partitioning protein